MKTTISNKSWIIIACFLFIGCKNTRYLTEVYIKNHIEQHVPGEQSTIKTYSIYQGRSIANKKSSAYIEFTGCKYEGRRSLIVGADQYYILRNTMRGDMTLLKEPTYVVLDVDDCLTIVNNYNALQKQLASEHPIRHEEIYHDFTVTDNLFISFRRAPCYRGKRFIDVWVHEDKYTIKTRKFIKKLKRFINY